MALAYRDRPTDYGKLEPQAQRYGSRRLRSSLDAIHQTDLALKGAGALRPELALERLVIALGS